MRKISIASIASIALSTLSLSIASQNLMAYNTAAPVASSPTASTVSADVPDYSSVNPEILLKNAIKNPDGSLTIKAGQQTAQANDMNRIYCELVGGTDITNGSDRLIEGGTLYPVVCKSPVGHYPPAIATAIFRLGSQPAVDTMAGGTSSLKATPKGETGMYSNPFSKK
jgi:hypothetical protein